MVQQDTTEIKPATRGRSAQKQTDEIPLGYARVRVLPKGHGQVHTGKNVAARLEPDPEREALTGDARLKADAAALVEASVACGQTYGKGAVFDLPTRNAKALEDRGHVEIL